MEKSAEVILIEDSVSDIEVVMRALRKAKLDNRIIHFEEGDKAQEYIFCTGHYSSRSVSDTPRLVILDLKVPKVSGMELLRQIKSDERTKLVPVVILTASREDKDIRNAYELGANSYLVKAADYDEFSQAIIELGKYWLLSNHTPN